ncbi:MAG: hypothetical protein ACLTMP_05870 [Eggerthella lenta]
MIVKLYRAEKEGTRMGRARSTSSIRRFATASSHGRLHEHRGEVGRGASTSPAQRGRHRGGLPISSPGDFESVRRIAELAGDQATVCGLTRAVEKTSTPRPTRLARQASAHPYRHRLSPSHRDKLRITEDECVERAVKCVKYARNFVERAVLRGGRGKVGLRLPRARHPGRRGRRRHGGEHPRHHGLLAARGVRRAHQEPHGP